MDKFSSPFIDQFYSEEFSSQKVVKWSAQDSIKQKILSELSLDPTLNFLDPKELLKEKISALQKLAFQKDKFQKPNSASIKKYFSNGFNKDGTIEIESFTSNKTLPYGLSEQHYTRIYANPRVSMFGLPFQSDLYYTTEDNSYFNTNSISFSFDVDAFKDQIKNKSSDIISQKKKELIQLSDFNIDLDIYKNDINRQKSALNQSYKSKLSHMEEQFSSFEIDTAKLLEQLTKDSDSVGSNTAAYNKIQRTVDSSNQLKQQFLDSINYLEMKYQESKNRLNQYLVIADSLKRVTNSVEQAATKIITHHKILITESANKTKKSKLGRLKDSINNHSVIRKFISTIDEFEVGLYNPFYSKNTINGIPIKGLNVKRASANDNLYTRISVGNSVVSLNRFNFESAKQNLFSRHIIASKIGYGEEYFNDFYLISAYIWDPVKDQDENSKINIINGVGYSFIVSTIKTDLELTHTFLRSNNDVSIYTEAPDESSFSNFKNRLSFYGKSKIKFLKSSNLKLEFDQKNYGFSSLASPFLRNDYRSYSFDYNQKILKEKISYSGFYKYFRDNISNLNSSKNEMKGFGITAQSHFKKKPNFMVSYTPFEQGNNHQDSLLKTNNKFRSLNAQISYQKSIDKHFFYSIILYNLATVEYQENNLLQSNTRTISFNQLYQNNKIRCNIGYLNSITNPSIDTLSFNSINASVDWKVKKFIVGANLQHKYTLSDGKMLSQAIFIERNILKSMSIKFTSGYRYIDQIWGMNNENIIYGMLNLRYQL